MRGHGMMVAPPRSICTTRARPSTGSVAAMRSASAGGHSAAIVGPEPDSHAHHAPAARAASSAARDGAGGGEPHRLMQPVGDRHPQRVDVAGGEGGHQERRVPDVEHRVGERHAGGEPAATVSVRVVDAGTHTTSAASSAIGTRTAWPAAVAVTPPSRLAAALSAWPSSSVASASTSRWRAASTAACRAVGLSVGGDDPGRRARRR